MEKKTFKLTGDQVTSLIKLINDEIDSNNLAGNGAYNSYWDNVKMALLKVSPNHI